LIFNPFSGITMSEEPKCYYCKHGQLFHIDGKEYYICYRKGRGEVVEPRYNCPWFEPEDEEDELEEEIFYEEE